jgi:DNA-binding transcriptional ArsR family regulator
MEKFNLSVCHSEIEAGSSPKRIAEKYGLSLPNLSYYLRQLLKAGLIRKVAYGTWETVAPFSEKEVKKLTNVATKQLGGDILTSLKPDSVRGHALVFRVKVPNALTNWKNREAYLIEKKIHYTALPKKKTQRLLIGGSKVWLSDRTLTFYFKESFLAETPKEAQSLGISHLKERINALERLLNVSFEINRGYIFKVSRQHYALVKNALARQYNQEGKRLYVTNHRGLWFLIDNSYNLEEAEGVSPASAVTDTAKVQDFFNSLKENPITTHQINGSFAMILSAIRTLTENVSVLAKEVEKIKDK